MQCGRQRPTKLKYAASFLFYIADARLLEQQMCAHCCAFCPKTLQVIPWLEKQYCKHSDVLNLWLAEEDCSSNKNVLIVQYFHGQCCPCDSLTTCHIHDLSHHNLVNLLKGAPIRSWKFPRSFPLVYLVPPPGTQWPQETVVGAKQKFQAGDAKVT